MKNRLIITISTINGSKQYSVHQIIKKVIFVLVMIFLLIGVGTLYYIQFLSEKIDHSKVEINSFKTEIVGLKAMTTELKTMGDTLQSNNDKLKDHKAQLLSRINEDTDKLYSVNEYLREVEDIMGIGPDINTSFSERIVQAKEQEQTKKDILVEHVKEESKQEKITAIQKMLLLNNIPNGKPLKYKRVSSEFGYRVHPVTKRKTFHAGLDLPAKHGTPIYAPASGAIVYAKKKGHYGNFILIAHSYGFKTAYGHLSRFAVKSGDYVSKGQKIGYVGSTGRSTGPHLHYEVRYLSKWLDPKKFMFMDLDNINNISDRIDLVNWTSILKQTEKLISLSTK
ncbi:MAG: M23 family metallopeptidase [Sulfurovum sp.]|nr:M23 family metallopeptidase [Sulfurovum sp.]